MKTIKEIRREKIEEAYRNSVGNFYHNATPDLYNAMKKLLKNIPHYDDDEEKITEFIEEEFSSQANFELEYINGGMSTGKIPYLEFDHVKKHCDKYITSSKSYSYIRNYYRRKYNREFDYIANILEFGQLYQYGRGGRTVAPDGIMTSRQHIKEDCSELSIENITDRIRLFDAFNLYVNNWNKADNLYFVLLDNTRDYIVTLNDNRHNIAYQNTL